MKYILICIGIVIFMAIVIIGSSKIGYKIGKRSIILNPKGSINDLPHTTLSHTSYLPDTTSQQEELTKFSNNRRAMIGKVR